MTTKHIWQTLIFPLFFLFLTESQVYSDQCRSHGIEAWLDVPKSDSTVPPNTHFRVFLYPRCNGIEGPEHQFRVVDPEGHEASHTAIPFLEKGIEIVPEEPLPGGSWTLEVRKPISETELGPWESLTAVQVEGTSDTSSPKFDGIAGGGSKPTVGLVWKSPCEKEKAWKIGFEVMFEAALDEPRDPWELLYILERRATESDVWEVVGTFRPDSIGQDARHDWESRHGWDETWTYRLRVRDLAGNETIGARTITIKNPPLPDEPVDGEK